MLSSVTLILLNYYIFNLLTLQCVTFEEVIYSLPDRNPCKKSTKAHSTMLPPFIAHKHLSYKVKHIEFDGQI